MRSQNKTVSVVKFKLFHVTPRQNSTQAIASSLKYLNDNYSDAKISPQFLKTF